MLDRRTPTINLVEQIIIQGISKKCIQKDAQKLWW